MLNRSVHFVSAADLQPSQYSAEEMAAQLCRQEERSRGQQWDHSQRQHLGQNILQQDSGKTKDLLS